ncbi:crosslink repair DNA glycosylase YcaQ family protein [Microbacterium sp. H1-D42]|uniref:DNA glycosylase AlkZ-like family protein n=1 Tax=Microbacterium sp. H1-D42 TaxID=2925844 RepID=UPI001F52E226|nr:crosslink repair DNA glycosylase YcaQ family protein [Microbacterium sp. H1-D42]UNK72464.1 winged helix DNA-binding domain-containing protein [Microbacterium sp. H1-D42]
MTPHVLTREQARRIIVRAELLDAQRPGDVVEVAEQIMQIKIDPTAVVAPSEQTIPWSRIGWSYEPGQLKKAVEDDRVLFEYYGAFRPASLLPAMRQKMEHAALRSGTQTWLDANERFRRDVLARLGAEGPLFSADIPDTSQVSRASDGWSGSNQVPAMLEVLAYRGEVAIVGRRGRQRCWDLAERVYPAETSPLTLDEATAEIEQRSLQAAGLAQPHYHWSGVGKQTGEPAAVEGSSMKFRVDPAALAALDEPDPGGRVALLNPYDRMLFDRTRLVEVFEFTFVLEQFKPKSQRVFGYFAHPILCGDRFIGMLDAEVDRPRETLRVNAIHELTPWEPDEHELVRAEIGELADWLGVEVSGLD